MLDDSETRISQTLGLKDADYNRTLPYFQHFKCFSEENI